MRTFLALDIPSRVKQEILKDLSTLYGSFPDDLKWVSEANLHITAQFIGDVSPQDIADIVIFLQEHFSYCEEIHFFDPKFQFVPGKRPSICWINLDSENPEMEKIIRKFRKFLLNMGYKTENRKLIFHITIFRIKKRLPENLINQILTTELKIQDLRVSSATLYESVLRPQGPDYYEIAKFKLQRS